MVDAVHFYQNEQHYEMAKFYFHYGDLLLTKQEINPDVFGDEM